MEGVSKEYEKLSKLGEGTYGVVYKAKKISTNQIVALKKIKKMEEGISSTTIREISILKELNHPNIVKLIEVLPYKNTHAMIFEYVDQDLHNLVKKVKLKMNMIKSIVYQILSAIDYCHKQKIIHRDLKPMNILISKDGVVKVADFGLSRYNSVRSLEYAKEIATLWYRSIDILLGNTSYSGGVDVWSVGCIMGELVRGKAMFRGGNLEHQIKKILSILGNNGLDQLNLPLYNEQYHKYKENLLTEYLTGLDDAGYDLLSKMLDVNPKTRITTQDALAHKWLQNVDKQIKI